MCVRLEHRQDAIFAPVFGPSDVSLSASRPHSSPKREMYIEIQISLFPQPLFLSKFNLIARPRMNQFKSGHSFTKSDATGEKRT